MKKSNMITKIAGGLIVLSTIIASTASWWVFHQPETPDLLK